MIRKRWFTARIAWQIRDTSDVYNFSGEKFTSSK